jgi:predicted transcriptional regulator
MKNPSGNKLEKLVFGMFDQMIEGADKYVTKQGSTWLIFTEDKRWVVEFTNDKTLWFNYNVFQGELDLIGKDCVEERDLIKNWFESRFLNKPKVKEAHHVDVMKFFDKKMENTIQNGVRHTIADATVLTEAVEDTIQGGVKEAKEDRLVRSIHVMSTIINGVKETKEMKHNRNRYHGHFILEDDIPTYIPMVQVQDVIENGVKHVEDGDWLDQDERIEDIIENGVKELKELPDKSGELRGYGDWYHRQGNMTKPHTEYVKEIIEDSYNHMGRVEGVIRNTDKDGI